MEADEEEDPEAPPHQAKVDLLHTNIYTYIQIVYVGDNQWST